MITISHPSDIIGSCSLRLQIIDEETGGKAQDTVPEAKLRPAAPDDSAQDLSQRMLGEASHAHTSPGRLLEASQGHTSPDF